MNVFCLDMVSRYFLFLFLAYETNGERGVFLTVSSLASYPNMQDRQLELNWYNLPEHTSADDAWIRLFSHQPVRNDTQYLVTIHPANYNDGRYRTSIRFPEQVFEPHNLTDSCLGFWIAYVVDADIVSSSCIRARPNWMAEQRDILGNVPLSQLVIPGTHNAGSYGRYDPDDDTIIKKYIINQEESIWHQLVYGMRYLDLRVAYEVVSGTEDRFWITHSIFTTSLSIRVVVEQIKAFLNATDEIVIMDFHRFVNGFSGRRARRKHRQLIQFLESELSDYMIPASVDVYTTLNELWAMNRRLLVGYAANSERSKSLLLHPAVKHLWGDKDRIEDLFEYLNGNVCRQARNQLTSAMVQLTPTTSGTIFDVYGGLRKLASEVNLFVAKWLRELWWHCANIVSTDFFLGSNVIETAIEINKKKFLT